MNESFVHFRMKLYCCELEGGEVDDEMGCTMAKLDHKKEGPGGRAPLAKDPVVATSACPRDMLSGIQFA